jgi:toxin-antitoxin system PIN domain toxin
VILVDANLLIYAVDSDSHFHRGARSWFEETLSGTTAVGLPWVVLLAFLRVTTRPGLFQRPLAPEHALEYVESWLDQPYVTTVAPGDNHWPILRNLLQSTGTAGNLTSDAHLAALAIEYGAPVYSTDHDFGRFPGIEHVNPLTAI